MGTPSGDLSRIRGHNLEIEAPGRLVMEFPVFAADDTPLFRARTGATIAVEGTAKRLCVTQS